MLNLNLHDNTPEEVRTDSEIMQIADELMATPELENSQIIDTIENIISIKEYVEAYGYTDELKSLIGEDAVNYIKNIEASNEGLGEAIGKFFKWIADAIKRLFGMGKAKQAKIDQCIETVTNTKAKTVTLDKLIKLDKLRSYINNVTAAVNELKTAAASGKIAEKDTDKFSEAALQKELDDLFKEMITEDSQEMSKNGADGYLKELKKLMTQLDTKCKELDRWKDDFRAKFEAKGDVKSFVNPLKMAQAIITTCGKVLNAVKITVTVDEQEETENTEDSENQDS